MFSHAYFHHNVYLSAYSSLCLYTQHPPRTGVPNSWRSTTHSPERAIATRLTTVSACSHMPTFTTMFISVPIPAYVCIPSTRLVPVCLLAGGPRPIHLNVPLQPDLRQFLHVHTCLHMFTHAYLTKMFISMPIPFYVYPAHSMNRCLLAGGPRPIHMNVPLQPTLRHLLHVHHAYLNQNAYLNAYSSLCLYPSTRIEPV